MIKNIVFDMGKVLMEYEPEIVCRHYTKDAGTVRRLCSAVFESQEWLLLDMGLVSEEDALKRMQSHLETETEKELASLCFRDWHLYNKWPKEGMEELVKELKEKGFDIYLLSNASMRVKEVCSGQIPGTAYMSGMLFSAEVQYIKPQKEIYETLFARFSLKPEECFFVDDSALNIAGGKRLSMDGYCFADGDVAKLRETLLSLNG